MLRTSIIAVACWTLLLVPVLCMGGVLIHACACTSEESCTHEDHCESDPCADSIRPSEGTPDLEPLARMAAEVPSLPFELYLNEAPVTLLRFGCLPESDPTSGTYPLLI